MTATLKLYEIADARAILDEWLSESEGEITPELEAMLAEVAEDGAEKIERVALYVRERRAHAAAVKEERDRLDAIVKRETKAADSLLEYLHRQMDALNTPRVIGKLCTVAIQKNSQPAVLCSVDAFNLNDILLRKETISYTVDREEVLRRWKANEHLPAEISVVQGSHVRIR